MAGQLIGVNVPMLILDISMEVESDCVVDRLLYAFGLVHSFAVRLGFCNRTEYYIIIYLLYKELLYIFQV